MMGPFQVTCVLAAAAFAAAFSISTAFAQQVRGGNQPLRDKPSLGNIGERINSNTISIVSGNINATYLSIAYDMSAVLDNGDEFRVLPVIGKGGGQNIRDVRFLKGIDLGITQTSLLNTFRRTGELGNIDDKIVYIAKLFNEELHVVVRAEAGITSLEQLAGKKVNFSDIGSGTQLTTRDIFTRLKIKAEEVNMGQADAFEKLKSGEIAATVLIAGKPAGAVARIRSDQGFRFLNVPFAKELHDAYLPALLTNEDYPGMVGRNEGFETVAVGAVLIAFNWPKGTERYRRIENFVEHFFPSLAQFQKPPRHPKWREANLAAVLPGWTRFPAAEDWLKRNRQIEQAPTAAVRDEFGAFLAVRGKGAADPPDERERLFQEFLKWSQARERR
jgi:TRAP transporter TAXI family solute receptor